MYFTVEKLDKFPRHRAHYFSTSKCLIGFPAANDFSGIQPCMHGPESA